MNMDELQENPVQAGHFNNRINTRYNGMKVVQQILQLCIIAAPENSLLKVVITLESKDKVTSVTVREMKQQLNVIKCHEKNTHEWTFRY
jgi:hypothetical protein